MDDLNVQAIKRSVGRQLRYARHQRGMTIVEATARLQELTGDRLDPQTLYTYEWGTRSITVVRLADLADVYETAPRLIVGPAMERLGFPQSCPWCGRS